MVGILACKVTQTWVINNQNSCKITSMLIELKSILCVIRFFSLLLFFTLFSNVIILLLVMGYLIKWHWEMNYLCFSGLARCWLCCPGNQPISCWSWLARAWRTVETCCFTEDCSHHSNWNKYWRNRYDNVSLYFLCQ